jgi:hypothetical protein
MKPLTMRCRPSPVAAHCQTPKKKEKIALATTNMDIYYWHIGYVISTMGRSGVPLRGLGLDEAK